MSEYFNPYKLFYGIFIPEALLRCKNVTPAEKITYGYLCRKNGKNNRCYPGMSEIADATGLSKSGVINAIKGLAKKEFIKVQKPQGQEKLMGFNNRYWFLHHQIFDGTERGKK